VDRVEEIPIGIVADARLFVRGDVGRVEDTERQFKAQAAGIFLATLRGVTDHAIRRARQISSALDEARFGQRGRNPGGIAGLIVRQRYFLALREGHGIGAADDPNCCDRRRRPRQR